MLENAALDMPNEASGGSECSQTSSYSNSKSIHSDMIVEPNDRTVQKNPLTLVLSQFATVMKPMVFPTNDSNCNTNNNTPSTTESKETALNEAVKRMVGSSKMDEASKEKMDEASVLLQEHHKHNCKKVRIMMKNYHN